MAKPDGDCGAVSVKGNDVWACTLPADHRGDHCDQSQTDQPEWPRL